MACLFRYSDNDGAKEHYSRASGMISMVESASNIIGPVLAGSLIGVIGIRGILLIDIITFFVAFIYFVDCHRSPACS